MRERILVKLLARVVISKVLTKEDEPLALVLGQGHRLKEAIRDDGGLQRARQRVNGRALGRARDKARGWCADWTSAIWMDRCNCLP